MAISVLKIRRPLGRLIFNMGIAIPGKTVFLIETAPWCWESLMSSDCPGANKVVLNYMGKFDRYQIIKTQQSTTMYIFHRDVPIHDFYKLNFWAFGLMMWYIDLWTFTTDMTGKYGIDNLTKNTRTRFHTRTFHLFTTIFSWLIETQHILTLPSK